MQLLNVLSVQLFWGGAQWYLTLPVSTMISWLLLFLKDFRPSLTVFCTFPFSAIILGGTWSLLLHGPKLPIETALSTITSPLIIHFSWCSPALYCFCILAIKLFLLSRIFFPFSFTTLWNSILSSNVFPFSEYGRNTLSPLVADCELPPPNHSSLTFQ